MFRFLISINNNERGQGVAKPFPETLISRELLSRFISIREIQMARPRKFNFTKEELKELYIDKKLTKEQIAKIKGCGHILIYKYLKKFGLYRTYEEFNKNRIGYKMSKETKERISKANKGKFVSLETRKKQSLKKKKYYFTKEELVELYIEQKKTIKDISKIKKCGLITVYVNLKKFNIIRTVKEAHEIFMKGIPIPQKVRDKISNSHKGKGLSEEHKKNISKARTGISMSEKQRRSISCALKEKYKKEKHHLQKDQTEEYKNGLNKKRRWDVEYRIWREQVFDRDSYTCQKCKTKGIYLQAHHIESFKYVKELRYDIGNGITLCKECHKEFHVKHGGLGKGTHENINRQELNKFLVD